MSTAEILSLISLFSYIIAGICLVLAVLFWFLFKIPSVIGDLSGRTARKSIARLRANNERAGAKGYKPSTGNIRRGKVTETVGPELRPVQAAQKPLQPAQKPLQPVKPAHPPVQQKPLDSQETELLPATEPMPVTEPVPVTKPVPVPAPMTPGVAGVVHLPVDEQLVETGILGVNRSESTQSVGTEMLESQATGLLDDTESLETAPLPAVPRFGGKRLVMLDDVMLIHTDEVI